MKNTFPVLRYENQADFDTMLASFRAEFQPATEHESFLVEQMAIARWRIARLQRIEAATLDALVSPGADPRHTPEALIAFKFENGAGSTLASLQRMMSAAERSYHKAHAELGKARQLRKESKTVEALDAALVKRVVTAPPTRTAAAGRPASAPVHQQTIVRPRYAMAAGDDNPALRL